MELSKKTLEHCLKKLQELKDQNKEEDLIHIFYRDLKAPSESVEKDINDNPKLNTSQRKRAKRKLEIIKLDTSTNRIVFMTPFSWVSEINDRFNGEEISPLLGKIKTQKGWSNKRISQEIKNRINVLEWMRRENLRSYKDVGKIVAEYHKNPNAVIKMIKEESS